MANRTTKTNGCVITANLDNKTLSCGYSRVRVFPEQYSSIVLISSMTGKTIQDVVSELLAYAISNTSIDVNGEMIKLSKIGGAK